MILVDANVLLYAFDADSPSHEAAARWLTATLESEPDVRFATATVLAFVRISTDPRVFERPLGARAAIAVVETLLDRPNVSLAGPTPRHWGVLAQVADDGQARGPMLARCPGPSIG